MKLGGPSLCRRIVALLCPAILAACGPSAAGAPKATPGGTPDRPLTVFAAASLVDLFEGLSRLECVPVFEVHYAGSELLLRQVAAGAPADVLVMARPFRPGDLPATPPSADDTRALLSTSLVLACAASRPDPPQDWAAFQHWGAELTWVLADPELAPAGRYARRALEALGVWERWSERALFAANVRAACTWVAWGEADVVLCYRADAEALADLVVCFEMPVEPVTYTAVNLAPPTRRARAGAWLDSWSLPEVQTLLREHHFRQPGTPR